ncbi:MAG: hypothetical protein K2P81_03305 [Bacteriovoracaceae bacterium]|nr:hypothetical protein [Bacteriovoracaceae bacterium]
MKTYHTWQELFKEWKILCENQFKQKKQESISIGLEIEFFLFDSKLNPIGLDDSQRFMKELENVLSNKYKIKTETELLNGRECLTRIKCEKSSTTWDSIGYEYPPHLLELSLSYHSNLHALEVELKSYIQFIKDTSKKVGLKFVLKPKLNQKEISSLKSVENKQQGCLRESRLDMLNSGPFKSQTQLADFPSYLAATHFHIAGHKWWLDEKFVNRLYQIEPFLMNEAKGISIKERWQHYFAVFHSFPLVGMPDFKEWNFESWMKELFNKSYINQKKSIISPYDLNKLRDLQVIRPRAIGTIEFRSDAAQESIEGIMRLAAIRLGQYLLCLKELPIDLQSYSRSRELWIEQFDSLSEVKNSNKEYIFRLIRNELFLRSLGEEKFLNIELSEMIA